MEMEEDRLPEDTFQIHAVKSLSNPARPGLAQWDPMFDLLAVVTSNDNVLLYRMNGQRVWGQAQRKEESEPDLHLEALQWKPNGQALALGYSDGITRMCEFHGGKITGRLTSDLKTFRGVSSIGWAKSEEIPKLPADYTMPDTIVFPSSIIGQMDVTHLLPKLSAIPSSSAPDSIFTSKQTVDTLVNVNEKVDKGEHFPIDVLIVADKRGHLCVSIYESFTIGTINLSTLCPQLPEGCEVVKQATGGGAITHGLIIKAEDSTMFCTLDLLFINQFGEYLHQLAAGSSRLKNLLRYMNDAIAAMQNEWKTMNELPARFLRSLIEDLKEKEPETDMRTEFLELLCTGLPTEVSQEWLVDILGERGLKRWEKATTAGYESLKNLSQLYLLEASERLTILLSRSRGLAKWKEKGSALGMDPEDFTMCIDATGALISLCHSFNTQLDEEFAAFREFTTWLKILLDELSRVIEINDQKEDEEEPDVLLVADYIDKYLGRPALEQYFPVITNPDEEVEKARKLFEKSSGEGIFQQYATEGKKGDLPSFRVLHSYLTRLCDHVFKKPAAAMKRGLRLSRPLVIGETPLKDTGLQMVYTVEGLSTYILTYEENSPNLYIAICEFAQGTVLSEISKVSTANIRLPGTGNMIVTSAKFVDEETIIVVMNNSHAESDKSHMMTFSFNDSALTYTEYPIKEDRRTSATSVLGSENDLVAFAKSQPVQRASVKKRKVFDTDFMAQEVQVNGRSSRRIGAVFNNDGQRYQVFDLDDSEPYLEEETELMDVEE